MLLQYIGMSSPSGKGIELDAVGSTWLAIASLNPTPYSRMRLHAAGTLVVWPGMLFQNSFGC